MQKYEFISDLSFSPGKFKFPHKGHVDMFRQALSYSKRLIIGVCGIDKIYKNNLADIKNRYFLLDEIICAEGWQERIAGIIGIQDLGNDLKWLRHCQELAGNFDSVATTNPNIIKIFGNAGYQILPLKLTDRQIYEGSKLESLLLTGGNWEKLVHEANIDSYKQLLIEYKKEIDRERFRDLFFP